MTDNELLLAISNIMDRKIEPLDKRFDSLDERVDHLEERFDALDERVDSLEENVQTLNLQVKKINIDLENSVKPQLREIQSCYVSTYKRYQHGIEKNEQLLSDMTLVKEILIEHNEKLQKIS